jgi:predicted dithiol-disulfide oxidoreductase (DUF899 family)
MEKHRIVPHAEWVAARKALLAEEKEFNRLRDRLSEKRRNLPWERVEKDYVFDGPSGKARLAQLFAGKSQLLVYHFMFDPDWEAGCKSCSFWADNFSNIPVHLKHRDVSLVAISRAPLDKIEAFRKRMGWSFPWYSSHGSDFNFDYHVSFRPEDRAQGEVEYNYRPIKTTMSELPGISVFFRDEDGAVYHTYSTYARGLDMLNGAYHMLDLVPKGRDEEGRGQFWVRLHDRYED